MRTTALYKWCTWLSEGTEDSIFLRTVKNSGVFCEFYAWFFMNAWFISWSASVFSRYRAHVSAIASTPDHIGYLNRALWSVFEFLRAWFSKNILHRPHCVLDTLPYLICSCYTLHRLNKRVMIIMTICTIRLKYLRLHHQWKVEFSEIHTFPR